MLTTLVLATAAALAGGSSTDGASGRAAASPWSSPKSITPPGYNVRVTAPGPGGPLLIGTRSTGNGTQPEQEELRGAIGTPDGRFGRPFVIDVRPTGIGFSTASNARGDAVVTWNQGDSAAGSFTGIRLATRVGGGQLSAPITYSSTARFAVPAISPNGRALLVQLDQQRLDIAYRAGPRADFKPRRSIPLSDKEFDGIVRCAINDDGDAVVVWTEDISGDRAEQVSLHAAVMRGGVGFGPEMDVAPSSLSSEPILPDVAIGKNGDVVFAWESHPRRRAGAQVFSRSLDRRGRLGKRETIGFGRNVGVSIDRIGDAILVYAGLSSPTRPNFIRAAFRRPGHPYFGSPKTIGPGFGYPDINTAGKTTLVTWTSTEAGNGQGGYPLWAATTRAGQPFTPAHRIGRQALDVSVGFDGRRAVAIFGRYLSGRYRSSVATAKALTRPRH